VLRKCKEQQGDDLMPNKTEKHPLLGSKVPALKISNQKDEIVDLAKTLKNQEWTVLYFYPKDSTPGCTTEACDFRDNFNKLKKKNVLVLGVSPDSQKSHIKFIEKFDLNFDLLADEDKALSKAMKVWKLKKFMGREYMGVERSTFIFKGQKLVHAWQPVKVAGHVDEILKTLKELGA
jgi:thioredoxin-dependent peroxiredoxin